MADYREEEINPAESNLESFEQDEVELLLDESRGIYIPRDFTKCFNLEDWGFTEDEIKEIEHDLSSPDNELYWETWDRVLLDARCYSREGKIWYLYQDGDLFAYTLKESTNE